ncbi:MAG: UDP-N-acetylmuramoyl-L-alanine--D-glutamate ligase [Desulfobulbaceae bacterium]|nr:UDP-N-acetylmuramoyl-L-alanine--D-glutamate ligase [Desulfobulbaceae bacterium]
MMALPNNSSRKIGPASKVLVVGLGRSGRAAVKLLHKLGAAVTATDSATLERLDQQFLDWAHSHDVKVEGGAHSDRLLDKVDLVVVSPGVPLDLPLLDAARGRGVAVVGEMALAAGLVSTPIVAITGTNGKSTVTELIGAMFLAAGRRVFVGGNLGQPLSEYLLDPYEAEVLVLEVSSFQLDTAPDFRPEVAVLLNISPDHLDRYVDYEHYAASKFSLFSAQTRLNAAVLNADDHEIMGRLAAHNFVSRRFFFGCNCPEGDNSATINGLEVIVKAGPGAKEERYSLAASELGLEPNLHNGAAAIIAARLLDCPAEGIRTAIAEFKTLGHRLEKIAEIGGVLYLDDSKATNIGAVAAALAGINRPVVLIAGGRDKGGDYRLLAGIVKEKVKGMILIGEARDKMAAVFSELTRVALADDLPAAVRLAASMADRGDVVLLSPACASFDMFTSYGHRGQVFKDAVLALR